ncbi:MAG: FliM/FliN family flagellar motor C-terminal domain-containing protein [Paracoccaceae bacterium]
MGSTEDISILQRKLKEKPQAGTGDVNRPIIRALRLSTARVSRDLLGLCIDVIGGGHAMQPPDALATVLKDDHLLLFLEGEDGISGAVGIDPELARALVQQQTTGALAPAGGEQRAFTDTDAALCAPVIEDILNRAAELAELGEDHVSLSGHRFGARASDGKSLSVALNGERFRAVDLTLDIGSGSTQGNLVLILPDRPVPQSGQTTDAPQQVQTLGDVAFGATVRLNAVMCRVPCMLSDLAHLKPGDLIPLPPYRLDRTELLTVSGQSVGAGRLGRVEGLRAVRVNETETPDPDFVDPPEPTDQAAELTVMADDPPDISLDHPADGAEMPLDMMDQESALKHISELAGLDQQTMTSNDAPEDA